MSLIQNQNLKEEVQAAFDKLKNAKLVGCVNAEMVLGMPKCPIIDLCPIAPEKGNVDKWDLRGMLAGGTYHIASVDDDMDEKFSEHIKKVLALLEKAEWISSRCPLRKVL